MLAQKQNEPQVPTEIEQSEFDAILKEMHEEKHRLVAEAKRLADELEAKQVRKAPFLSRLVFFEYGKPSYYSRVNVQNRH